MKLAAFEKSDATLTKQLDVVLKQMNVERQAYHGKSFIGNHVHTCCKVTQIPPLEKQTINHTLASINLLLRFIFFCTKTTSLNYAVL